MSKVVADAEVLALALDTAEEMTTNLSCFGVMMTKQAMWSNLEIASLAAAIELENRNQLLAGYTGNLDEAIAAFREKRPPSTRSSYGVADSNARCSASSGLSSPSRAAAA